MYFGIFDQMIRNAFAPPITCPSWITCNLLKSSACVLEVKEIAKQLNVGSERIRCIEAKALRKLKHPSKSKILKTLMREAA